MNKMELVAAMAESAGITKAVAAKALDAFTKVVTGTLKKGDTVTLIGFGSFYVGERSARNGRNPRTGAVIKIPASKTPKFRAGKTLKDAI